ncbi:MAG: protein kinase [Cyanobacteria bacterium HKST-UBA01]|nr:protein kinase [Cyanobacteria bacterium HKST-UBA01]
MEHHSEKEKLKEQKIELKESSTDEAGEIELVPELPYGYELIEKLGEGGMGRVYRVRDLALDKEFAIKILQQDLSKDASALKRFNQEIDAAAALSHANLISIYKHGTTDNGEPYLVMDYLKGPSLAELIEKGTDFAANADRLLDIFIQICEALAHAHENGVIHRDIKPSNIIITKSADGKDLVKIVDFGIARVIEASNRETHNLTQTGEVFGSPHYMSPEQCLGLMLTQHSDIYSLGCTLYEAITGSPPFAGANPIQLVVKHINENVSGFDKDLKRSKALKQLETITLKCLSKEMDDRYASVTALKEDLEKIKEGKPIPKYVLANRAKPTITKRQMLVFFALAIGLLIYGSQVSSSFIPGDWSRRLCMLFMVLLFGPGFIFLIVTGWEKLKSIKEGKDSARQWWLMLMAVSTGVAGLCAAPSMLGEVFFGYVKPVFYEQVLAWAYIIHIPFITVLAASAIGLLIFKARSVKLGYILSRLILILVTTFSLALAVIPDTVAGIPKSISNYTNDCLPALSAKAQEWATNLSRDKYDALCALAHKQFRCDDTDGAIKSMTKALDLAKDKSEKSNALRNLANFYAAQGQFQKALETLDMAANQDTEIFDYDKRDRAAYLKELGMLDQALNELKKYQRRNPLNSEGIRLEALIYAQQGQMEKALGLLDMMLDEGRIDDDNSRNLVFRGILREEAGLPDKARQDFEKVVKNFDWKRFDYNYAAKYGENYLATAYAFKRLGMFEDYHKLITILNSGVKKIDMNALAKMLSIRGNHPPLRWDAPPLSVPPISPSSESNK